MTSTKYSLTIWRIYGWLLDNIPALTIWSSFGCVCVFVGFSFFLGVIYNGAFSEPYQNSVCLLARIRVVPEPCSACPSGTVHNGMGTCGGIWRRDWIKHITSVFHSSLTYRRSISDMRSRCSFHAFSGSQETEAASDRRTILVKRSVCGLIKGIWGHVRYTEV